MTTPDHNFLSIADCSDKSYTGLTIDPRLEGHEASEFADILKLSNVQRVTMTHCSVRTGGTQIENAVDMNRNCTDILLEDCFFEEGRENAVTIKGGCQHVVLHRCQIYGSTAFGYRGHCDIELGNWSDQSQEPVRNVHLNEVVRADGKPVRVRVGHAEWPHVDGGYVRIMYVESLLLKCYWWLKWLLVKLPRKATS